jgi:hypothetical protein
MSYVSTAVSRFTRDGRDVLYSVEGYRQWLLANERSPGHQLRAPKPNRFSQRKRVLAATGVKAKKRASPFRPVARASDRAEAAITDAGNGGGAVD